MKKIIVILALLTGLWTNLLADNNVDPNMMIHYSFGNVNGKIVVDESGNGYNATLYNNATVTTMGKYKVMSLGTSSGYLDMGASAGNILKNTSDFTISIYYMVDNDASLSGNGYFLWAFSQLAANTATSSAYMTYRLNAQRFATSTGGYNNENGVEIGSSAAKGSWHHVIYRQKAATGELYIDGKLMATNMAMPILKGVFTTATTYNWIGRPPFSGDNYLKNAMVYDFRFYGRAISNDSIKGFATMVDSLNYEYLYGTPGDFTELSTMLNKCKTLYSTAETKDYLQSTMDEMRDDIDIVEALIDEKKASQTLIDNWVNTLGNTYNQMIASKGLTINTFVDEEKYDTDRGFIHPGCLNSQADFDRVKAMLAVGNDTITKAYNILKNNAYAQANVATYPVETVIRGGSGENYMNAARGAAMAYQNALCWKISGDAGHAKNAVNILMAWANGCKDVSGNTNMSLAAGLYGYEFANAAELMRDYTGWSANDFNTFKKWMMTIWYPKSIDFLRRRHDTWLNSANSSIGPCPGHYWSNWGLCNTLNVMSIGILCDDPYVYNQGLSFYKYDQVGTFKTSRTSPIINDGLTEFIGNLVPDLKDDARGPYGKLGQMQESGRDQGHALMALGLSVDVCQTVWNQGNDLFAYMDNRLAAGIEHVAALNFGGVASSDMPWTSYWYHDCRTAVSNSWQMTGDNTGGLGGWRPYWSRILGHYEGIKGVRMRYSEMADSIVGIDAGGGNYGQTSGGFDHLGFSTLMCKRPAISPEMAPTTLKPTLIYNGVTYNQSELGGLKNTYLTDNNTGVIQGSKIELIPTLPEGITDTGIWQWSTGETTKGITITADKSKMYRVYFTNDKGVKSSITYTIAVEGDCIGDIITPSITVNGTTVNDTTITVMTQQTVTLGASASAGWGTYKWSNGETGSTLTVTNINRDRTYTVNYMNQGGEISVVNFHLHTYVMTPSIMVEGDTVVSSDRVIVTKGQTVKLIPVVAAENIYGSWKWSDGSTERSLTVKDIQHTVSYTVVYSLGEKQDSLTFIVYVPNEKEGIADGIYYIVGAKNNQYLTNVKTIIPSFKEKDSQDSDTQKWTVTKDGDGSKITNLADGRYLNKYAHFTSSAYDSTMSTYKFYGVENGGFYSIQNSTMAGSRYWGISTTNTISGIMDVDFNGFPFELIPAIPTSISEVSNNKTDIWPRVINDYMTVNVGNKGGVRLTIITSDGRVMKCINCKQGVNTFEMNWLKKGMYLCLMEYDHIKKCIKLIKG